MRNLLEEAELADQLGLDLFAIGEHHRPDYLVSSPAVVLAALAVRTQRIRLSSAVSVLSSDDPVRVFQDFAHVDLLSGGRAEIMAGRGSFIESFPALRLRPRRLRRALLREARAADPDPRLDPRHLVRPPPAATRERRRLAPPDPGPAADLGSGRRHTAVRRPSRGVRPAAHPRDHRRRAGAFRAPDRPLPRGLDDRRPRPGRCPSRDQHPRLRSPDAHRSQRSLRPPVHHDDEPDRPGARLATSRPARIRSPPLTPRGARGRHARAGRREDPFRARALPKRPLHRADERRSGSPPGRHALDRALRHRGRAGCPSRSSPPHRRRLPGGLTRFALMHGIRRRVPEVAGLHRVVRVEPLQRPSSRPAHPSFPLGPLRPRRVATGRADIDCPYLVHDADERARPTESGAPLEPA
jgi:hypothetical protein